MVQNDIKAYNGERHGNVSFKDIYLGLTCFIAPYHTHTQYYASMDQWKRLRPSCFPSRCREVWMRPRHCALCGCDRPLICSDSLARHPSAALACGMMHYGSAILWLTDLALVVMPSTGTLTFSLHLFRSSSHAFTAQSFAGGLERWWIGLLICQTVDMNGSGHSKAKPCQNTTNTLWLFSSFCW